MRVKCRLCVHESNGFCTKKTNNSKPIKIELNKSRVCDKYEEDGMRVLGDYRKNEAHKKNVAQIKQRNMQIHELIQKSQEELAERRAKALTPDRQSRILIPGYHTPEGSDDM